MVPLQVQGIQSYLFFVRRQNPVSEYLSIYRRISAERKGPFFSALKWCFRYYIYKIKVFYYRAGFSSSRQAFYAMHVSWYLFGCARYRSPKSVSDKGPPFDTPMRDVTQFFFFISRPRATTYISRICIRLNNMSPFGIDTVLMINATWFWLVFLGI